MHYKTIIVTTQPSPKKAHLYYFLGGGVVTILIDVHLQFIKAFF